MERRNKVGITGRLRYYEEEMNVATYMVGMRQTGFSIGTQIKLRCYDKHYELQKDPIKWGVFAQKYGRIPDVLTRVEFQLRRVALKEFLLDGKFRLEGVNSYLKAREQLWLYLTEDWFRLTEDNVDAKNNHQSRAKTWSVWQQIQKAVTGVVKEIYRHARPLKMDMEALYKQALGCLCKMSVFERGSELETAAQVLEYFWHKIKEHGFDEFWRTMQRHYDELHKQLGFAPVISATRSEQELWEMGR